MTHATEGDAPPHPAPSDAATGDGCYICQPDNPNAAEEGCEACERTWWAWYFARVIPPEQG